MRLPIALLAGLAAGLGATAALAAPPAVEIKDAVAQVTVIPEDRSDIRVEILTQNRRLPLKVKAGRARTIVDGGVPAARIRSCTGADGGAVVRVAGVGEVPLKEAPQIVVHAPRDVDVSSGGAVFGAIGRARTATLGNAGCGDWTVANVEQQLRVSLAGSGGARTGSAGQAKLRVTGSGGIATGEVRGRLDVDVAGSGDVHVRSVAGPLDVHIAGSGGVTVDGGRASAMTASVAGSGDIVFGGVADSLDARIVGSGDVRAHEVRGKVKKAVMGSGAVRIG
jgi:hypothetical protein